MMRADVVGGRGEFFAQVKKLVQDPVFGGLIQDPWVDPHGHTFNGPAMMTRSVNDPRNRSLGPGFECPFAREWVEVRLLYPNQAIGDVVRLIEVGGSRAELERLLGVFHSMKDPLIDPHGHTFGRATIDAMAKQVEMGTRSYTDGKGFVCPKPYRRCDEGWVSFSELRPNLLMRDLIEWVEQSRSNLGAQQVKASREERRIVPLQERKERGLEGRVQVLGPRYAMKSVQLHIEWLGAQSAMWKQYWVYRDSVSTPPSSRAIFP